MYSRTKHELVTAGHYLCIGVIAEAATLHWHSWLGVEGPSQLFLWLGLFIALSIARFIILLVAVWMKGNQWQTISRRNW